MNETCIRHPENSRYIKLYAWQIQFCRGNHCAALLIAYFAAWHDWKRRNDEYYRRANDIAEAHGDGRLHSENAYLFFTTEQLIEGCMGLYGKKAIVEALNLLVTLDVISIHKNPNPRYHFDKTKYFLFYAQTCNRWLAKQYPVDGHTEITDAQVTDCFDQPKVADRNSNNSRWSSETTRPSRQNYRTITNTTNNTTNKKQTITEQDDLVFENNLKNAASWVGDLL